MADNSNWCPARWREEINLVDLSCYNDDDLLEYGKLGIFLLVLKYIYDPNIMGILEKLVPLIRHVEGLKNGQSFLHTTFEYLYRSSRIENKDDLERMEKEIFEKAEIEFSVRVKKLEQETEKNALQLKEQFALRLIDEGLDLTTVVRCSELSPEIVKWLSQKPCDK